MRIAEFVIQSERPLQLRDSLIILTRHHERAAKIRIDDERKRVQLHSSFIFADRFIKAAERHQKSIAIPVVRRRVIRIQLNRAFKFLL